ncbi:MAG TPA: S8 family serine peptidase [Pseudonocardiaceae bacterium]|nr:S8 family serine peptidase [Pseudonocardiaceae bacterium]
MSVAREPDQPDLGDSSATSFLAAIPQAVLDRHGARVLDPASAPVVPGWPVPTTTAYRVASLMIPNDLLGVDRVSALNDALETSGMELVPPAPVDQLHPELRSFVDRTSTLSRSVRLTVRPDAMPTVVDAYVALQHLRASANSDPSLAPRDAVSRISLEHLMFPGSDVAPWEVHEVTVPGSSYVPAGSGAFPVSVSMPPPPRRRVGVDGLGRRPVVAVLDTGIAPHPWFDIADRTAPPPANGFLEVDAALQDAIQANNPTEPIPLRGFWDTPSFDNPLIGNVDIATGHGTFIAGIIRQAAPDARVLAIRVAHSDGVAYEGDVVFAMWYLVNRVAEAQANNLPHRMVDIVSLSLGYFDETTPSPFATQLTQHVDELIAMGVPVTAAAGNASSTRPFYPAALAGEPGKDLVVSVGALNPNRSKALFSNDGSWVRHWERGAAVVSTFPTDVRGGAEPDHAIRAQHRAALDPDDFSAGFAVWNGTSFATPLAAAKLATAMVRCAAGALGAPTLALEPVDPTSTLQRAERARKALG